MSKKCISTDNLTTPPKKVFWSKTIISRGIFINMVIFDCIKAKWESYALFYMQFRIFVCLWRKKGLYLNNKHTELAKLMNEDYKANFTVSVIFKLYHAIKYWCNKSWSTSLQLVGRAQFTDGLINLELLSMQVCNGS